MRTQLVAEAVIEMDDEIDRMNRMAHEDLTEVMLKRFGSCSLQAS